MIQNLISDLQAKKQLNILAILILSTLFSLALVSFRIYYTDLPTFKFLVWNLFLAWIPYWISLFLLLYGEKIKSFFIISLLLIVWLLFFPNSPYILTDLFHLGQKIKVPLWYDLILILSFAWTGMFLGFLSLVHIQDFITKKTNVLLGWAFAFFSLILSAFGIYLGRYLRWNSWNVLTHPERLFTDILERIFNPFVYRETVAMTIVFSAFLIIVYLMLKILSQANNQFGTKEVK